MTPLGFLEKGNLLPLDSGVDLAVKVVFWIHEHLLHKEKR